MAVRFGSAAANSSLSRTTNLPTITSFTLMGWVNLTSDRNTYSSFLAFGDGTNYYDIGTTVDGTSLMAWNSSAELAMGVLSLATWYHIALVVSGTGAGQLIGYLNGAATSGSGNATPTAASLWCGSSASAEWLDGRMAAIKIYAAALSAAEVAQEMRMFRPVRTLNLNTWLPCVNPTAGSNNIDYSGNGNTMTVGGTLTSEDGPPLAWSPLRRFFFLSAGGLPPLQPNVNEALGVGDIRFVPAP